MAEPWIKLYRKFLEWEWYSDINCKVVFLHLLLTANWERKKWQGISIDAGELVTSNASLAHEVCLSVDQVRLALKKLVDCGAITRRSTNRFTLISIKNFKTYQTNPRHQSKVGQGFEEVERSENPKQIPNKSQTDPRQTPTPKELKNERNKEYKNIDGGAYINNINNNTKAPAPSPIEGQVFKAYEQNIGVISPIVLDILRDRIQSQGSELVLLAITEAVKNNARSIRYIEKVLNAWQNDGIKTADAAKLRIQKRWQKANAKETLPGNVERSRFRNYPKDNSIGDVEREAIQKMMAKDSQL